MQRGQLRELPRGDPDILAGFRDVRCHSSIETIRASLVGNDRDEHIFALTQSLELYDFYHAKVAECDRKLEAAVAALPKARTKGKQVNTPAFDVRGALYGILGTDLTQIHGLGPALALKLVGECGTDLRAWPSAKHFTSWLCLAPGNKSRRQAFVFPDPTLLQPSRSSLAAGGHDHRSQRHGIGRLLSLPVIPDRQAEGCHRHRPQNCCLVLQHLAVWYGLS